MASRIEKEVQDRICSLYNDGDSMSIVAEKTDVSIPTVRNILVQNGVKIRPKGCGWKKKI